MCGEIDVLKQGRWQVFSTQKNGIPCSDCAMHLKGWENFATKVHVGGETLVFLLFSSTPFFFFSILPRYQLLSPHISHPSFCASAVMWGMTACQWSDQFPKQHCERPSMHFVLNCFNEAVEINLWASRSRPPAIAFQRRDFSGVSAGLATGH